MLSFYFPAYLLMTGQYIQLTWINDRSVYITIKSYSIMTQTQSYTFLTLVLIYYIGLNVREV